MECPKLYNLIQNVDEFNILDNILNNINLNKVNMLQEIMISLPKYVIELYQMLKGWKAIIINDKDGAHKKSRKIVKIKRNDTDNSTSNNL